MGTETLTGIDEYRKILLVEDEVLIALTEKRLLEKHGFSVETVESGEKALEIINGGMAPDLILMDINLGSGMDGTEAASLILEKMDIPVVFLSSHTNMEVVRKTEGITSYGYIVKHSGETVMIASIRMAFRLFEAKMQQKESERQLETLIANLPGFIYRCLNDPDWTMVYISSGCSKVTGYSPEELTNNRALSYADIIHPDHRSRVWNEWQSALVEGKACEIEYPIRTRGGSVQWIWERGRGVFSPSGELLHLEGFIQDISGREKGS